MWSWTDTPSMSAIVASLNCLNRGFTITAANNVILVDLEYSPEEYPELLELILQGHADVVYGSRFLGRHRVFLFTHYIGNRIVTLGRDAGVDIGKVLVADDRRDNQLLITRMLEKTGAGVVVVHEQVGLRHGGLQIVRARRRQRHEAIGLPGRDAGGALQARQAGVCVAVGHHPLAVA